MNGHIVVVYNVGTNDHPIGEANVKVNDNSYHLIRFVRSGPNSTLQIDDNSMQTLYPSGTILYYKYAVNAIKFKTDR